jgi:hypothetical protein
MDSQQVSPQELERRRKISEAKRGKPRPDVSERMRKRWIENPWPPNMPSDEARARMAAERTIHGHGRKRGEGRQGTSTYYIWGAMIQRCTNPRNRDYPSYGARGITVCDRWHKFENFLADMGERPDGLSLDRIDNDGNYEPGNCHWATPVQQANNRRPRH